MKFSRDEAAAWTSRPDRAEHYLWCIVHEQPSEPWRGACFTQDPMDLRLSCVIRRVYLSDEGTG